MGIGFFETTNHSVNWIVDADCLKSLPDLMCHYTDWTYSFKPTEKGCLLTPTFRNVPYRNAFAPEISIEVSQKEGGTDFKIIGKPIKPIRIFMALWFLILAMFEVLIIIISFTSGLESILPLFVPVAMCVFGYCLCKIGTLISFKSIAKAIKQVINNKLI